jgi:hypothetical protein
MEKKVVPAETSGCPALHPLSHTHTLSRAAKNRNLSLLISNLSRLGHVNATVFIVFQQCLLFFNSKKYPVLVYPVIFPVWFLSPAIRRFLTYTCKLASNTLFHTHHHTHRPLSIELVCNQSPFLFLC